MPNSCLIEIIQKKKKEKEKVKKQCMTILGSDRRISLLHKSIVFIYGLVQVSGSGF
jgi:hypothetical protein